MPQTIENIVQCHRDARALRAAGKPIWAKEVKLKDLFNDSTDPEVLAAIATGIASRFKAVLPPAFFDVMSDDYDSTIGDIVDDLETWTAELVDEKIDAQATLNGRLEEIYDWADANRVWIG